MKKVLFSLSVFAVVLFAAQSCTKNSNVESPSIESSSDYDQVDNSTISEEEFEMQEDPIGYEPEAAPTLEVTGGTKVANSDADGKCTAWDNKATYLKSIKIGTTPVELTLTFSANVGIDSVKNTNTKTGVGGTNTSGQKITFGTPTMGTDSMHWKVTIASSDTFRLGSARLNIKYKTKNTKMVMEAKEKNATIYCMGANANGVFSSQKWGHAYEGGDVADLTATPTAISLDSANHWKPAVGDVIVFGTSGVRGLIKSIETPVAPTSASGILKGPKYKFKYVVWNTTCKGSRKNGSATIYGRTLNTVKAWTGATDVITGYVR